MSINEEQFERLVGEALDSIPDEFWNLIDNLAISIMDWPTQDQMVRAGLRSGGMLLGLYEGVPLTERSTHYGLVAPDKVTIFRKPILHYCPANDEEAIRAQVRRTVLHEIAHHFGISDERLMEIGAY